MILLPISTVMLLVRTPSRYPVYADLKYSVTPATDFNMMVSCTSIFLGPTSHRHFAGTPFFHWSQHSTKKLSQCSCVCVLKGPQTTNANWVLVTATGTWASTP